MCEAYTRQYTRRDELDSPVSGAVPAHAMPMVPSSLCPGEIGILSMPHDTKSEIRFKATAFQQPNSSD